MKTVAIQYTCRNPGQTVLLWAWQPKPFGHGWIDVKVEPDEELHHCEYHLMHDRRRIRAAIRELLK